MKKLNQAEAFCLGFAIASGLDPKKLFPGFFSDERGMAQDEPGHNVPYADGVIIRTKKNGRGGKYCYPIPVENSGDGGNNGANGENKKNGRTTESSGDPELDKAFAYLESKRNAKFPKEKLDILKGVISDSPNDIRIAFKKGVSAHVEGVELLENGTSAYFRPKTGTVNFSAFSLEDIKVGEQIVVSGSRTMAHEFGHALDYYGGRKGDFSRDAKSVDADLDDAFRKDIDNFATKAGIPSKNDLAKIAKAYANSASKSDRDLALKDFYKAMGNENPPENSFAVRVSKWLDGSERGAGSPDSIMSVKHIKTISNAKLGEILRTGAVGDKLVKEFEPIDFEVMSDYCSSVFARNFNVGLDKKKTVPPTPGVKFKTGGVGNNWGHYFEYWQKGHGGEHASKETFAELFSLKATNSPGYGIYKKSFPNMVGKFEGILKDMANG